ncbi:TraG/TraD family protein [Ureaplasma urealyticum serovar 9 str. ATCC 33175]|nr:TraG/TraD family protein [Ureaplasma urealyticum serovar 9 str. ATCC 33175]
MNKVLEAILSDIKNLIKIDNPKKFILSNIPYLSFFYIGNIFSKHINSYVGGDIIDRIMVGISDIGTLSYIPSLNPRDLLVGISVAGLVKLIVYSKGKNKKKYRQGKEYGSARWGESKDIAPYIDPKFENNVLITNTERLTMNSRPKNPKYARNKNVLVIGGSGSGKTRFYVKPNLMQMHSSYVVTDPKGTLVLECGKMLYENGYDIKILNTINFKKSMKYNPFAYLRSEKDILKLVQTIIANTKGDGEKAGEDFWVKAEKLYYTALIGYIYYEAPEEEKNFKTLLDMIDASEVREDDETYMNPIDRLFEALEKKDPSHFAVKQYKKYKLAAGKTAKSILISCGARLAPFDIRELRELMSEDELELDKIGDRKTALFVIISDTDDTFNFVVSIMYSQLFNLLCDKADDVYGGRLPVHVRCLLDEFANIGLIPKFEKLIATIRSREISASIILQAQSQLKAIYKDHADTIVGNCDSTLFLGGKEKTTVKELSETLGKETIDLYNTSETRSNQKSFGLNYQKTGKELMSQDEITVMDGGKCIYQLRGVRPFLSDKFDITKHKNYKLLEDYDKRNLFDVEEYLKNRDKVKLKSSYKINRLNIWVYGESKMCENRKSSLIILNINGEQFILESDTELTRDKKNYIEAICEAMYDESNEWYEDIYDMSPYDIAELFEKTVKEEVGITVTFKAIDLEVSILED